MDDNRLQAELMQRFLGVRPRTSEERVLRLTVETGVRAVAGDEGSLLVFDPAANDLTFVMTYGNPAAEAELLGQRVPIGQSLMGLAAETGEVQIGAPRYKDPEQTEALEGVRAVLAAPMMIGDRLIGVLTAISKQPDKRFTLDDAELYACLATIAALVVDQALALRSMPGGRATAEVQAVSVLGDPLEQEVLARIGRLFQRDRGIVRHVALMLESIEAMAEAGSRP